VIANIKLLVQDKERCLGIVEQKVRVRDAIAAHIWTHLISRHILILVKANGEIYINN
jgi:hypothetical protein